MNLSPNKRRNRRKAALRASVGVKPTSRRGITKRALNAELNRRQKFQAAFTPEERQWAKQIAASL